jgi:creatinine amidohydrolase/Fe(II)-dependent formamide hydrolase-like protein
MLSQPANVFISPSEFRDDPAAAQHHSATGVRGDPTLATAEKGRVILAAAIAELVAGLRPLCPVLPA